MVHIAPDQIDQLDALTAQELRSATQLTIEGGPWIPGLDGERTAADIWTAPAPRGEHRAVADERHRLALFHPRYDGFLTLTIRARCDLDDIRLVPDASLARVVTAHHRIGLLARGQERPIDLELHPGAVPRSGSHGEIAVVDAEGIPVCPAVVFTLAVTERTDCLVAGELEGPWPVGEFQAICAAVRRSHRGVARAVRQLAATDPEHRRSRWKPW